MMDIIQDIMGYWDIPGTDQPKRLSPEHDVWAVGEEYILKADQRIDYIMSICQMTKAFSKAEIPVAPPIPTREGADFLTLGGQFYLLSRRLSGQHPSDLFSGEYKSTAFLLGRTAAWLHEKMTKALLGQPYKSVSLCKQIRQEAGPAGWSGQGFSEISGAVLKECLDELSSYEPSLTRCVIHRDLHCKNLLFENGKLSGCIDFSYTQENARIFDICYLSRSILIEYRDDPAVREKWPEFTAAIISGYESLSPLSRSEKQAIPSLFLCIELSFIGYFALEKEPENAQISVDVFHWIRKKRGKLFSFLEP